MVGEETMQLEQIIANATAAIEQSESVAVLEDVRVQVLGKKRGTNPSTTKLG